MKSRTWHDVVDELTTDPATGTRIYGSLTKIVKATGIPRSTLDVCLRKRTSPRNEVAVVHAMAKALGVPPMRLFCPDEKPGADREAEAVADVFYNLSAEDRETLMRALADPDAVRHILGALSCYPRARLQAETVANLARVKAPSSTPTRSPGCRGQK